VTVSTGVHTSSLRGETRGVPSEAPLPTVPLTSPSDESSGLHGGGAADRSSSSTNAGGGSQDEDSPKNEALRKEREAARKRDEKLVQRTLSGDRSAFQELFEIYRPKVQSLAFEILKSTEDAEDVVQESFVKAYLALPKYRGQAAFYTWLFRIVYNMAIDYKRRIARRGGDPVEFQEETLNSAEVSSSYEESTGSLPSNPHEAVEVQEELEQVQQAMRRLSDEHRAVLSLREVDGLSYDEIAEVAGISKGTVMSRLHYARKALLRFLGREG
jgi:RNA polymerase sigma-70 factor (ECF subfamily)